MCTRLFLLSKNHSIANVVWAIKRASSKWVKGEGIQLKKFHWQEGYGAFSISQSHVERVQKYILNQERHHGRKTFKDEFRALLTKHDIEYDERYVWD
jgi:putative transposase